MEEQNIKLIWDFKGQDGKQTALHHEIHLNEFLTKEKLPNFEVGMEQIEELHHIAYMMVDKPRMIIIRDALLPHRGQIIEKIDRES